MSPHHLQLFDYYSPPARPDYYDRKYSKLRSKSSKCRVVSSETELTSRLKSPLPKGVFDLPASRPLSVRSSRTPSRESSPRRQGSRQNANARVFDRVRSAPSHRQISHLQGHLL